jgi:hypothetical protein
VYAYVRCTVVVLAVAAAAAAAAVVVVVVVVVVVESVLVSVAAVSVDVSVCSIRYQQACTRAATRLTAGACVRIAVLSDAVLQRSAAGRQLAAFRPSGMLHSSLH